MNKEIIKQLQAEDYNDGYYHVSKDITEYPDAWCIVVWSKRGPGKTYSALRYFTGQGQPFVYMKRTKDDIELICTHGADTDLSPFKDINRDFNTNIKPKLLHNGIGGFWETDEEGNPGGKCIAYLIAMNAVAKIKGIGLSECGAIIFDEFIPQLGETVRRAEGNQLLDLYMTIRRDRVKRGLPDLKLILFANGTEIYTPVTETLEIVDSMVELEASGDSHKYIEDRGILLHHITEEEIPTVESEKNSGIYKAMENTAWGRMALGGELAYNDFSNITKLSINKMRPFLELKYKNNTFYIYLREADGLFYMCRSKCNAPVSYDLNFENDQKAFYIDYGIDLKNACIEGRFKFQSYTMYNLIVNYKKYFTI